MSNVQAVSFLKLTTTDTTASSLVVGAATADGTTGTGGVKAGPVACATVAATTSGTFDTGTIAGEMPATGAFTVKAIHQMTGTTDILSGFFATKSAIDGSTNQALQGYAYSTIATPSTITLATGMIGNAEHAGTGTVTTLRGTQAGFSITSSGGGTDAVCYNAAPTGRSGSGSGTYTNGYGVKIGAFGAGITNKYSLHSSDVTATLQHAGPIAVSGTSTTALTVTQTDTTDNAIQWVRSAGTTSTWKQYLPSGSTDLRFYANAADRVTFTNSGSINLPTGGYLAIYDPNTKIGVDLKHSSNVNGGQYAVFRDAAGANIGSITEDAGFASVSYNLTSDARLKHDLGIVRDSDVLPALLIHDFRWASGHLGRGVFAQEAHAVYPAAVTVGGVDPQAQPWQVDYSKFVPELIVGWQQHQRTIADLERRLLALER